MAGAVLEISSLAKRYGKVFAVRDVSMEVGRECHGLVGPNGAGKTTTLKSVVGLVVPDRGRIVFMGEDLLGGGGWRLRRLIGYVAEVPSLPRGYTAEEFLTESGLLDGLSLLDARRAARRALEEVGLDEKRRARVDEMSKGQRKKLMFAQAMMLPRELYVLDEPLTGLDPAAVVWARDAIKRLSRESAVLVSSHLLREIEAVASSVTLINRGVTVYTGTIDELRRKLGLMEAVISVSDVNKALRVLAEAGFEARASESSVLVKVRDKGEVARAIRVLVEAGIDIYEARMRGASLEEAYIRLIGGG